MSVTASHIAWLGGSLRTDGSMLTAYISVGSNSPSPNPSSSLSTIVISRGSSSSGSSSGPALSRLERHIWHRQHSASPKAQLWPPFCSQPVSIIARLLHFNWSPIRFAWSRAMGCLRRPIERMFYGCQSNCYIFQVPIVHCASCAPQPKRKLYLHI